MRSYEPFLGTPVALRPQGCFACDDELRQLSISQKNAPLPMPKARGIFETRTMGELLFRVIRII